MKHHFMKSLTSTQHAQTYIHKSTLIKFNHNLKYVSGQPKATQVLFTFANIKLNHFSKYLVNLRIVDDHDYAKLASVQDKVGSKTKNLTCVPLMRSKQVRPSPAFTPADETHEKNNRGGLYCLTPSG